MKRIIVTLVFILLVGALGIWTGIYFTDKKHNLNQQVIVDRIVDLNRLETVVFYTTTIITKEALGDFWSFKTKDKKMIYITQGATSAGVDLSQLKKDNVHVSKDGKTITIDLPSVEIFHSYLIPNTGKTYNLVSGIFSGSDTDFADSLRLEAEKSILKIACQQNILTVANKNAQKEIENLFKMAAVNGEVKVNVNLSPVPKECKVTKQK